MVRGVTPQQDSIGCYATGTTAIYTPAPLPPLSFSPSPSSTVIRTVRLEALPQHVYTWGLIWAFGGRYSAPPVNILWNIPCSYVDFLSELHFHNNSLL